MNNRFLLAFVYCLSLVGGCEEDGSLQSKRTSVEAVKTENVSEDAAGEPVIEAGSINPQIQLRANSNIISWDEVVGAQSYNLLVSNEPITNLDGVEVIRGIKSPYVHIKTEDARFYYGVAVVRDDAEEFPKSFVNDEPGENLLACLSAVDGEAITLDAIFSSSEARDCYTLMDLQSTITSLDLSNKGIENLSALRGFTALEELYLSGNSIVDLSGIQGVELLSILDLSGNSTLIDISVLANLKELKGLSLSGAQVVDLSPLQDLVNIESLNVSGNPIVDLAPLQKLVKIQTLGLDGLAVTREEGSCPTVTTSAPLSQYCLEGVTVLYQPHIQKLIQLHCLGCHPNYDEAAVIQRAVVANDMIKAGTMPKGKDPLFPSDMAIFESWAAGIQLTAEED